MQGHSPDTGWRLLAEATVALRAGAVWVACNLDPTLPTERGPLPGNGSMVAALRTATGREPQVAGKPEPALLLDAVRRTGARSALMIGDRLDTDVEGGRAAGLATLLVLTGVSDAAELLAAPPERRPDYIGADLAALTRPAAELAPGRAPRLAGRRPTDPARSAWPGPATRSTRCARCAPRTGRTAAARCRSGPTAATRSDALRALGLGRGRRRLGYRGGCRHRTGSAPMTVPLPGPPPRPVDPQERVQRALDRRSTACPSARSPSTWRSSRTCTPR